MIVRPFTISKEKPIILLILGGEFHLDLYESLLETNRDFTWVVFIKDVGKIPTDRLAQFHRRYGTYFFTDRVTALAHFGDIDAVVTTFAVPHAAHAPYLPFAALACEMGIPVFEMQHGLFQIGLSYSEDSFMVGSGDKEGIARNSLPMQNLAPHTLRWFGEGAIGYPPFTDKIRYDSTYLHDEMVEPPEPEKILYLTNFHWNLLDKAQRQAGYRMISTAILALQDCDHILSPHPAELGNSLFKEMLNTLKNAGATNYEIVRPGNEEERRAMMAQVKVAVSSMSTILLSLEMVQVPTLLLDLPGFHALREGLEEFTAVSKGAELVRHLKNVIYAGDHPVFRSGKLQPFDRQMLTDRLQAEMKPGSLSMCDKVILINKYISKA